jgi:hypothetical protein
VEFLADRLRQIPGVIAVTLGGSRATGAHQADSDWDFGLYYRGSIDVSAIRSLGYAGTVVEPGKWGRLINGGAWLFVDGQRVDLLYREISTVEHWTREAEAGRFERDHVEGYVAGMTTYVLCGELALGRVLHGSLPRPDFPPALRESAPPRWFGSALFSLDVAETYVKRGDDSGAMALALKGLIAAAQGVLARRGEWALNEKRIIERAGLGELASDLLGHPASLGGAVAACRAELVKHADATA